MEDLEEGEVMETSEWYEDTALSSFWRNYSLANVWLRSRDVYPIVADLSGTNVPSKWDVSAPLIAKKEMVEAQNIEDAANVTDISEIIKEDLEVEVSSEYLEFIAQTKRHQKNREKSRMPKKSKNKQTRNNELVYRNITIVDSVFERSHIPTNSNDPKNSDMLRKLQSEQWYGSESSEIDKIETSIQGDYDQFVEAKSPSFWPETPLRMDLYFRD